MRSPSSPLWDAHSLLADTSPRDLATACSTISGQRTRRPDELGDVELVRLVAYLNAKASATALGVTAPPVGAKWALIASQWSEATT